jgi:DNA-binding transcriptional regulator YhcF (GntR family)
MNSKFPQLDSNARTIVSNAPLEVERNEVEVEEETKKNKVASLQKSFSFKNELLNLNFDEQLVDEWLSIRKSKKAKNTETALKAFIREIKKSNLPANEILQICVERSWSGFDASWINNLNTNKNGNTQQPINNEERKRSYIERVLYGNNESVDSQRSHNGEDNSAFDAVEIVES